MCIQTSFGVQPECLCPHEYGYLIVPQELVGRITFTCMGSNNNACM